MWNVKFHNDKALFLHFIYSNKENGQIKQHKNVALIYLLGGETANNVNFIQPMLVSYSSCYI